MFQGFSQATTDFLWGIRFNNERSWFQEHKQEYIDHVQDPMRELAKEVYESFTAAHRDLPLNLKISRIYRDARRLYGKGPYKSHLWFSIRMEGENWAELPVFWFEIYPEGYAYGLGIYDSRPATMARFRQAVDRDPKEMLKLAKAFAGQDRFYLAAEEYKRPKGDPPAPLDQWYNRKSLDLTCARQVDKILYSRALVDELLEAFEELLPYYNYFDKLCHRAD